MFHQEENREPKLPRELDPDFVLPPKFLPEQLQRIRQQINDFPYEHTFIEAHINSSGLSVDATQVQAWLNKHAGQPGADWVCMGSDPAGVSWQFRFKNRAVQEAFSKQFAGYVL